jgi:hypothetical protein
MLTNADCTIYHRVYDTVTRLDKWERTQYHGVNWYAKQAATVGESGLMAADTLTVRIPASESDTVPAAVGDIIVRGLPDTDITQPKELGTYEHYTITAVRDNRRGSLFMQHWRIEGK